MGPLALSDLIGNDIALAIMEVFYIRNGRLKIQTQSSVKKRWVVLKG